MRTLSIFLGFAVVTALSGCAGTGTPLVVECKLESDRREVPGPALVGQEYGPKMSVIPLDAVQYTDKSLTRRVAVQTLSATRTETETVSVDVRFVNCTSSAVQLGVRTSFMDKKQRPTEAASSWKTVFVQPRATATYSETSVGRENVANYLIEIREAAN